MVSNSKCCTSEIEVESAHRKENSDQESRKIKMEKHQNNWGHSVKVEKTNKEIDNILRFNSRKIFPEFPQVEATQNSLVGKVLEQPESEDLNNVFFRNDIGR